MPLQEDYQITLDTFRGPLDLLLYLIRRAEVDVHDIPIAQITDQYMAFLQRLDDIDIDVAGEFLVMAATLVEIKSRTLAPPQKKGEGESGTGIDATDVAGIDSTDPRVELVQQLLAYQRYRIASDDLEQRRAAFSQRFPRRPGKSAAALESTSQTQPGGFESGNDVGQEPVDLELEDAQVFDLFECYERIMGSIDFGRMGDHKVEIDDTPIALHQEDLLDRLTRAPARTLTLQEAFEGAATGQRIGLFLATLELVRLRRVTVMQPEIDSPIELLLNEDPTQALVIETDEIAHYGKGPESHGRP